jgi:Uma2 family endonuclease
MSAAPKRLLTPQEYLTQERLAPFKSEFYRGEVFAMAGASPNHFSVKDNMVELVGSQLKGGPCRRYSSDMRVKIDATGLYTYPDIVIVCGKPQYEDQVFYTLLNPQALVEVLSESTENYDRGAKFRHYQKIPSLQEIVLVAQDEVLLERHVRQPDDSWLRTDFTDASKTFEFASVPVRIPIVEIYRDVEFAEKPLR